MMSSLKAEFRKLFTVRSTYAITAAALLIVIFYAGYIQGYKADALNLLKPDYLSSEVTGAIGAVAVFAALIASLLITHEYSYGTIMYTLTASRSRVRSLLAKVFVITCFALMFALIVGVLSPCMTVLGMHLKHLHTVPQVFHYRDLVWQGLLYGWGYSMFGLMFGALLRNRVATIAALFLIPGTVELLLGLLLKNNVDYLPFNSLAKVIGDTTTKGGLTPGKAAIVALSYIVGGWIIALALFVRRDAN